MRLSDLLFGKPLASDEEDAQRVGVLAGIPMLGLDALASAAYGPEAALTVLLPLGAAGVGYLPPLSALILFLLGLVYLSYRQTIAAYPAGGGSYTVARSNLGTFPGLIAAAALLLDYVLVVAVGISAGVGALVSALPALQPATIWLCLGILAVITVVNLRGIRESGLAFAIPTYLFIVMILGVLGLGAARLIAAGGRPVPLVPPAPLPAGTGAAGWWLLLHAFASGCTAMTGVEAVSNGVTAFRAPAVRYARRTLTAIIAVLMVMLAGIAWVGAAYGIGATEPGRPGYQSVISQLVAAVAGRGPIYAVTIGATLAVLALSANTSFTGFPRLCQVIAQDHFLPHAFASRGRRLVFNNGILVLAALSGLLLLAFDGITNQLIPLFAVGAFLAFTVSQASMVVHWRRLGGPRSRHNMLINGAGALATALTLVVVLVAKFAEGAWISVVIMAAMVGLFVLIRRHYAGVARSVALTTPLDVSNLQPPLVVVPLSGWTRMAQKAIRFALKVSPDIVAVQVGTPEQAKDLSEQWETVVAAPARAAGLAIPRLVHIDSPYRELITPLMQYIGTLRAQHPDRQIAVIIPELAESRWYHYPLHKQRAAVLRARLFFNRDPHIVIVNVPWYLAADDPQPRQP
jgi:amino acid transporter